uniref:ATP-dependent RNA helicase n=1 Tax=Panagrolaimus sp. ES5 TaxID=591445 RepID=A0AC34EZ97_9BILA
MDSAKKQKYYPKPWWFYKHQQKKRERARIQQEGDNYESHNISKQSRFPVNESKKDTLLYRDDADITVVDVKGHVALRCNEWNEMDFDERLLQNIKNCEFMWPRKIQEAVIPYIIEGYDIKCQSETGTGKTAAYLIPIIDKLIKEKSTNGLPNEGPICVILAPTREITEQIFQNARKLAYRTGISIAKAYGEIPIKDNLKQLTKGCNILCACIGRLLNLMKHDHQEWDDLLMLDMKYLVIDEADYFLTGPETKDILTFLEHTRLPPVDYNIYFFKY